MEFLVCAVRDEGAHQHGMVQRLVQRLARMVVGLAVALVVGLRLKHEVHLTPASRVGTIRSMLNAAQRSTGSGAAQERRRTGAAGGGASGGRQATGVVGGGHVLKNLVTRCVLLFYSDC